MRALAKSLDRRLLIVGAADETWWAWLGGRSSLSERGQTTLRRWRPPHGTRFAFGEEAAGREGFRSTHEEALAAHRIASAEEPPVTHYEDVALEVLAGQDPERARAFVSSGVAGHRRRGRSLATPARDAAGVLRGASERGRGRGRARDPRADRGPAPAGGGTAHRQERRRSASGARYRPAAREREVASFWRPPSKVGPHRRARARQADLARGRGGAPRRARHGGGRLRRHRAARPPHAAGHRRAARRSPRPRSWPSASTPSWRRPSAWAAPATTWPFPERSRSRTRPSTRWSPISSPRWLRPASAGSCWCPPTAATSPRWPRRSRSCRTPSASASSRSPI